MPDDLKYWLAFSRLTKIGPKKFDQIRQHFPSLEYAWHAGRSEFVAAGITEALAEEITLKRQEINPNQELEKLINEGIKAVRIIDEDYPALLKEIYTPPFIIFYKGNLENLSDRTIGVIGTRKITHYGKLVTERLVYQLLEHNFIIVSGLALGVDSLAHQICVQLHKTTVAVLGGGLDRDNLYPSSNRLLGQQILANNGLLISEFPIGTLPLKFNFPLRNRIISGLSKGILITEAPASSGALITAKFALDQNREIFAIPGPINNPMSEGTNNLIKTGAKLVSCVEDVLEEFNLQDLKQVIPPTEVIGDNASETMILRCLKNEPQHINDISRAANLTIIEVNSTLMMLEIKNKVKNIGNMVYSLK